ncbi:hypothetical protein BO86DRAFT_454487 [Aspergillus japonicus CBS 114.51]|uniref:Uncharacterized protein n=1 Tax=Aspergillus japonicus CBS 114.51 TaxID=1448312 RepID=A0A8T8XAG2_ASPJA|nr:hypothetical protein BO86DRAFT_454487 [Aspergillus japonicus CBS 114.51]RAH84492.1 hypothetical protein BO86DRAFT_454487 [Aspergillus japonicus CBS 114.51]
MLISSRFLCLLFCAILVVFLLWRLPISSSRAFCRSDSPLPVQSLRHIDWSRFAYVQYATNTAYLCNSVMMFERLHQLQSQPDRVLMYPSHLDPERDSIEGGLLRKMQAQYRVRLVSIDVQSRSSSDVTWAESYTKFLAFNQTQYARVLSLDSDGTILQPWLKTPDTVLDQEQPACTNDTRTGRPDCRARELWLGFYRDFAKRRQRLCGLDVH